MTERRALRVVRTADRSDRYDYLVQLNGAVAEEVGVGEGDLVLVHHGSDALDTRVQARLQVREDLPDDEIGVDFTLRYALGVAAVDDVNYSAVEEPDTVSVAPASNQETQRRRRWFNGLVGVRPEVCRVRMAVHPDLENRICRISGNTMELIGIEEGDKVVIESADGIIRGLKAFRIDEESRTRKDDQRRRDPERYVDCYQLLDLDRIRETDVDIPEIYLDAEARTELDIQDRDREGVCQPVRVYRDSFNQFFRLSDSLLAAVLAATIGTSISLGGWVGVVLPLGASVAAAVLLVYRSQQLLK